MKKKFFDDGYVTPREFRIAFQRAGLIDELQSYYRQTGHTLSDIELFTDILDKFGDKASDIQRKYDLDLAWIHMAVAIAREREGAIPAIHMAKLVEGPVARPVTKELLKKLSIKAFSEKLDGLNNYLALVQIRIPEMLGIDELSEEEVKEAIVGIHELERDGFIIQAPRYAPTVKTLTARGRKVAELDLQRISLPRLSVEDMISRADLRSVVRDDYASGDFETAVFKAFRLLEEAVRKKAGLPPNVVGTELMNAAFKAGSLKHPGAQTGGEADAIYYLMRGGIGWFKNPSSHRTVDFGDEHQVAHALAFANLLLDLLDECE